MNILIIFSAVKRMTVNEFKNFVYGNYYKRIGFDNEITYYSLKRHKKRFPVICN